MSFVPARDFKLNENDIEIVLTKPNRKAVGRLNEAYGIKQNLRKSGQVNEISFSIPYKVEVDNMLVENKHVKKLHQRYFLKVRYLDQEEWYIVIKASDSLNDSNVKNVTAYRLAYQLKDKYLREWAGSQYDVQGNFIPDGEYEKESLNAIQVLKSLLNGTGWGIGKIDTLFLTRHRSFDFVGVTKLDAIFTMAEKFNAIISWNDKEQLINLHNPDDYGMFRGLTISDSKLLKSYERQVDSDNMATQLILIGQDGMSINEINPTGQSYIEDYSYFMKGFEMDDQGNVISSSTHMEDDLCKALFLYQEKVKSKQGEFVALLDELEVIENQITQEENALSILHNELVIIRDRIDSKQAQNDPASEIQAVQVEEANKIREIEDKEALIEDLEDQSDIVFEKIIKLRDDLSANNKNNFTEEQVEELIKYTVTRTWENEYISSPEELLELGIKELDRLNRPSSIYRIGIVNLLRMVDTQREIERLRLGDKVRVHKKELNEIVESTIEEINIDYDGNDISLVIADSEVIISDDDFVTQIVDKTMSVSSIVDLNKNKWDDVGRVKNQVEELLTGKWDASLREITAGVTESVIINERGITVKDDTDPNRFLRMMHGVIGMTDDGGRTFKLAIDATGVYAERLVGRIIAGQQLIMTNDLGTFTFDQNGVEVNGNNFRVTGGLNGVTISPERGVEVLRDDGLVRTTLNASDGIMVEVRRGGNWIKEFYYDSANANLKIEGEVDASAFKIRGQNALTAQNKISTNSIEDLVVGGNVIMGPNASINWGSVSGRPNTTYIDANGLYTGTIRAESITAGTMSADRIRGGTIDGVTFHSENNGRELTISANTVLPFGARLSIPAIHMDSGSSGRGYIGAAEGGVFTFSYQDILLLANRNVDIQGLEVRVDGRLSVRGAPFRRITTSTSTPSGGSDGDIWIRYQ